MISLLPKKLFFSILFGLVFFLGGAGTAVAADEYIFQYSNATGAPSTLTYGPFSDTASCNAIQQQFAGDTANYKNVTSCIPRPSTEFNQTTYTGPEELRGFSCGIFGTSSLTDCLPIWTYNLIYRPTSYLLMGSGYIFDKILSLSIEGVLVAPPFINSTWLVVRDFSNMLFIFILIYTGVQTILGAKDWRGTIIKVIVMALLINFSLFFTKVVIDAGNVLAVGIKNSISPGQSISQGLAGAFAPQQFLGAAGKVGAMDSVVVFIVASIVSGFAAYIFFKVAILFTRRLVVFWGLMIISPFAFVSIALPKDANKFDEWTTELIHQAFVAPIFLFFIYIIAKVLSGGSGILGGFEQGGGWFESLIGPVIVAALLIKALQEALRVTESFAGETGEAFSGLVSGAMGMATGGASLAARTVVGGGAAYALKNGMLREGSMAETHAKALTKSSFDVRNLGGKDSIFGEKIGGGIAKGVGAFGLGKGGGIGGVEKAESERVKAELKAAEGDKLSIFQEQGVRDRASKEAAERKEAGIRASESIASGAKLAKEQTSRLESDVKTAQKLHDESGTAKEVEEARVAYEESLAGPVDMNARREAKAKFNKATATHAVAGTSVALQAKLEELKKAKQAEEEALAATKRNEEVLKDRKGKPIGGATDFAEAEIEARNKTLGEKSALDAEAWGRHATAAKIRKGDKSGGKTIEDQLKDLIKKDKEEKEGKEGGDEPKKEHADESKH